MATNRLAFIMAGGSGERFWPLSRKNRPKQLLRLTHPKLTLLEEAVQRIEPLVGSDGVFVITGKHLKKPISDSNAIAAANVWAEPAKRNTLGALVWVAANLIARDQADSTLAILTADHKISDPEAFRNMVDRAMTVAETTSGLVTCGVVPTRPETGYGYIELDELPQDETGAKRVKSFREKPNLETALAFVESGRFLWNSGMFFWTVKAFLSELEKANLAAYEATQAIATALKNGDVESAEGAFEHVPNISIDFALMEKAANVFVVEAKFGWDDVGAWDAIPRAIGADETGSVKIGEVIAVDCENVVLYNESTLQTLAAVGLRNVVAVVTDDAILICPVDQAQRVKEIVDQLKSNNDSRL